MSQITTAAQKIAPGTYVQTLTGNSGGAVSSDGSGNINVKGDGTSITAVGNPGTNTITFGLIAPVSIANGGTNATSFTNTDGVVYFDGTRLVDTTVGTAGQVLTSQGAGMPPHFANAAASGITTIDGDTGSVTGSTVSIKAGTSSQNSGSSVSIKSTSATNLQLDVTDASGNTIIGDSAGNATLSGTDNVGLGPDVLADLTTGSDNVALGSFVLGSETTGSSNIGIGNGALSISVGSSFNVGVGDSVLDSLAGGGSYNIALGYQAGSVYTTTESSNIVISNNGTTADSNTIRIGTTGNSNGQQNLCYIAGINGIAPVGTAGQVMVIDANEEQITAISNTTAGYVLTSTGATTTPTWQLHAASSITITGDSGGGLTGNSFTFTGGSTGLTFAGAGSTETLGGTLAIAHGGTDSSSFNTNGVVISGTSSTAALTALSLSSGQVVIGGTSTPAAATLTAGAGISISNGNNTITINNTGAGFTWTDVTGGSATLAAQNGYIADSGSLTTFTMPTNNAFGDTIKIVGKGSGGWKIVYGALQKIIMGSSASTATTGNIASTNANDCIEMVCTTASIAAPIFTVVSSIGNISIT